MLKKKKDFKERKEIGWSRMAPIFSKPPTASSSLFHSACHGEERTRMMGKVRTSVAVSSILPLYFYSHTHIFSRDGDY